MPGQNECKCMKGSFRYDEVETKNLGVDRNYGEVSIKKCKTCGSLWLHYFYENEAFEKSGRWYCGPLKADQAAQVKPENSLELLEKMEWYFSGGSYFDGKTGKSKGKILINP